MSARRLNLTQARARDAARKAVRRIQPVARGFRRVWLVLYRIGAKWQSDGEWFATDGSRNGEVQAREQAKSNAVTYGWPYRIVPLDVPTSVFVDTRRAGGPNARARRQREAAESFRGRA